MKSDRIRIATRRDASKLLEWKKQLSHLNVKYLQYQSLRKE